jgi:hypothetical protein
VIAKLPGRVAATAIAAAVVTATPGFGAGTHGAGRHFVGGVHDPACFRHHRHFRKFAFVGPPIFGYAYGTYGNYCWQQVWTPSGWQWADACAGYFAFSH